MTLRSLRPSYRLRHLTRSIAIVVAAGCTTDPAPRPLVEREVSAGAPVEQADSAIPVATMLTVPTYERSGEGTHPDVVRFPVRWRGFEYWMAFTPYPAGREMHENPSIVVSRNGTDWQVPPGGRNPVMHRPMERDAYNSDPDLSYDAGSDRLMMVFRQVRRGFNQVRVTWSSDGVKWTRPRLIFQRPNHGMISPTIALGPDGRPRVWYVDAGPNRCQQRVTRVMTQRGEPNALLAGEFERGWTNPTETGLTQPGYYIWHLDVIYVPEKHEYWAAYPAYRRGECGARELFFATSPDGVAWRSFAAPMLRHEGQPWTRATLYRSSLLYDPARDMVRVFLSGADRGPKWHLGYVEFPYPALLRRLGAPTEPAPLVTRDRDHGVVEDR